MKIDKSQPAVKPAASIQAPEGAPADHAKVTPVQDGLALSSNGHGASGDQHDPDLLNYVAHKAHHPHGALHAVEAGEHLVHKGAQLASRVGRVAGRAASQGGRIASTAAVGSEAAQHAGHHGVIGKAEHVMEKGLARVTGWLGRAVRAIPGGTRMVNGAKAALAWPGRVLGPAVDGALAGTRLGNAVRMTGSGGRVVANMGGRIPILGALFGGVIGVADVKGTIAIMKDAHASTKEKAIALTQGTLSGVSGALGVGALGVAAAAAIGFTAPVSVPVLLGATAITGVGAFALSFFKKH